MKKIILFALLLAGFLGLANQVFAQESYQEKVSSILSVNPTSYDIPAGKTLKATIQLDPNNHKICTVSGYLTFASETFGNPDFGNISVLKGIKAEPLPTNSNPRFYLMLSKCATEKTDLMELYVKGNKIGKGSVSINGVIMYGPDGKIVASVSKGGEYNIVETSAVKKKSNFTAAIALGIGKLSGPATTIFFVLVIVFFGLVFCVKYFKREK